MDELSFNFHPLILISDVPGLYSSIHSSSPSATVPAQATSLMMTNIPAAGVTTALASSSSVTDPLETVESGSNRLLVTISAKFVFTPVDITLATMLMVAVEPTPLGVKLPTFHNPVPLLYAPAPLSDCHSSPAGRMSFTNTLLAVPTPIL
ncbi:MAG TPA: hypothetical protein PLN43_14520, partial [Anaerolineales bacterium]|nr:hypothetical protein [Anaerolineales bacterium]